MSSKRMIPLNLADCDITYYPDFIDVHKANGYFKHFRNTIPWKQDDIKIFGKVYPQPRLTAFFSINSRPYSYSNIMMQPHNFTKELYELKRTIETEVQIEFTSCLLNLYRNGKDSNGWHSDNEKELGDNPIIASLSLGQERIFHLRHKKDKNLKRKMVLEHGSLLLMKGETQNHWQHQIPKTIKPIGERVNLTFRIIQ